jgi:hypothetical protein
MSTESRWQSTIKKMEKLSMEQRIFKMRETAVSDQPSPTDKSKADLETVDRNKHQEFDQEISREVHQDSTEVVYGGSIPMKSTGW